MITNDAGRDNIGGTMYYSIVDNKARLNGTRKSGKIADARQMTELEIAQAKRIEELERALKAAVAVIADYRVAERH